MAQRELELGAQERERRPELVARVGDEAALVLERRLEPLEHVVQRLGEPRDLVLRRWHGQPAARGRGGDGARLAPHLFDRAQGRAGEHVPGERREQECERRADEQLPPQALERLLADVERARQHQRVLLVRAADRDREQAPASARARARRPSRAPSAAERTARELGSAEQRREARRLRLGDAAAAREHLRKADPSPGVAVERRLAPLQPQRRLGRLARTASGPVELRRFEPTRR